MIKNTLNPGHPQKAIGRLEETNGDLKLKVVTLSHEANILKHSGFITNLLKKLNSDTEEMNKKDSKGIIEIINENYDILLNHYNEINKEIKKIILAHQDIINDMNNHEKKDELILEKDIENLKNNPNIDSKILEIPLEELNKLLIKKVEHLIKLEKETKRVFQNENLSVIHQKNYKIINPIKKLGKIFKKDIKVENKLDEYIKTLSDIKKHQAKIQKYIETEISEDKIFYNSIIQLLRDIVNIINDQNNLLEIIQKEQKFTDVFNKKIDKLLVQFKRTWNYLSWTYIMLDVHKEQTETTANRTRKVLDEYINLKKTHDKIKFENEKEEEKAV